MAALYIDNFRGFTKTVIPLKRVNFLVGENSTGKSSLLALVHLLCSPGFWFSQSFNLPDWEFGGFRDILSATAQEKTQFSIGLFASTEDAKTRAERIACYLLSYEERQGLPSLAFLAWLNGRKLFVMRAIQGKRRRYGFRIADAPEEAVRMEPSALFDFLSQERARKQEELQAVPGSIPSQAGSLALPAVVWMLQALSAGQKPEQTEMVFPLPLLTHDLVWFAPIRTRPRRTYDGYGGPFSPEGEHTPYLLRKKLSGSRSDAFRKAIEAFGRESALFDTVLVNPLAEDAAAPFELLVELAFKCPLRINSVGYGVSQVLPLVAEMLARPKRAWFAIQQPEIHLHPKAQAALGDLVFQVAENDSKHFLIETHSDFTVDRFRMNFRRNSEHKTAAQVLFFLRTKAGNQISVIPIRQDGEYADDQPEAFRQFFLQEQMKILGL